MTQITRVFDNPGRAQAALDELKAKRFETAELIGGPQGRGSTTLQVDAPFGTAVRVEEILNRHANGSAAPTAAAKPAARATTPPAPAALPTARSAPATPPGKPDAAKPAASPRNGAHEGVKTGPRTLSAMLGIPELIDSDTFFSGFPLLIRPSPKTTRDAPPKQG